MRARVHLIILSAAVVIGSTGWGCRPSTEKRIHITGSDGSSDTSIISSYLEKADQLYQTDYDSMYYYTSIARKMAADRGEKGWEARAKAIESNYRRRKGDYSGAIALGLEVINTYDSLGMWKDAVHLKNVIADTYKEMGGEKGTIEYLQQAIDLARQAQVVAEKHQYIPGIIASYNQQAITWRDLSKRTKRRELMDTAFQLYEKGIRMINTTGEGEDNLGKFYNNISQIYNEHYRDYDKALEYSYKAAAFNQERNNQHSLTYNYGTLASTYINKGQLDSANYYALKMLALCKQMKSPFRMVNAYNMLTDVNREMGRYDSALYFRETGNRLDDSLNNVKRAALIAESQTKYETGKKEEQINELAKLNTVKNQRIILAFGMVAIFAILIIVSVLQNRRLQRQKAKISEQSERLQWMMKELHHRVKNNLQIVSSLLNLQTYRIKDEESVSAIKESQLRVQAMSLIHQRLYQVEDVSMVNFKLYLDDLVDTLLRSYGYRSDDFDLDIRIDQELLDVDTVMPMGLLVNEILTNAFKYAYQDVRKPYLQILLQVQGDQLQLAIRDNGPGITAEKTGNSRQAGFGKKLIEALSKQLHATWQVSNDGGTAYRFNIPFKQDKAA